MCHSSDSLSVENLEERNVSGRHKNMVGTHALPSAAREYYLNIAQELASSTETLFF